MIRMRYFSHADYVHESLTTDDVSVTLCSRSLCYPQYTNAVYSSKIRSNKRKRADGNVAGDGCPPDIDVAESSLVKVFIQEFTKCIDWKTPECESDISSLCSNCIYPDPIRIAQMKLQALEDAISPILKFAQRTSANNRTSEFTLLQQVITYLYLCKQRIVSNSTHTAVVWNTLVSGRFFIPPRSAFVWDDVRKGLQLLARSSDLEGHYEAIVCDPPWGNKSARRGSKYQTNFSNDQLLKLHRYVDRLTSSTNGCMLAVWVTNNDDIITFVKTQLLPTWGFTYVSTWWWLKITQQGKPVCEVRPGRTHRKPYERMIIGYKAPGAVTGDTISGRNADLESARCAPLPADVIVDIATSSTDDRDLHLPKNSMKYSECTSCDRENEADAAAADDGKDEGCSTTSARSSSTVTRVSNSSVGIRLCTCFCQQFGKYTALTDDISTTYNSSGCGCGSCCEIACHSELGHIEELCVAVESTVIPTEVIVSIPVRHSWKPPLFALLHAALARLRTCSGYNSRSGSSVNCDRTYGQLCEITCKSCSKAECKGSSKTCNCEADCTQDSTKNEFGVDLELFARELRSGCTSVGNEVLLSQVVTEEAGKEPGTFEPGAADYPLVARSKCDSDEKCTGFLNVVWKSSGGV